MNCRKVIQRLMSQYTLLLVLKVRDFTNDGISNLPSLAEKKEVISFIKNVLHLLTETLGGIVFSFFRVSHFAHRKLDTTINSLLPPKRNKELDKIGSLEQNKSVSKQMVSLKGNHRLSKFKRKKNARINKIVMRREKRQLEQGDLMEKEAQYRLFFHLLLEPTKVPLIHRYLKDQPNIQQIHLFRS